MIEPIYTWLSEHGLNILIILIAALAVRKFISIFVGKAIRKAVVGNRFLNKDAERKRENTLIRITNSTIRVLVWLVTALMVLSELGLNIGPLVAAAGVAGLAFGFGAQYLIRDVIAGLFIILENQYRVGDVACFDNTCGLVEDITLRMTTLRDLDGTVHHIPHGEIKKVSNRSKKFARINLDIDVSYSADLDRVTKVIDQVGEELARDADWKTHIIKPPRALGVQEFADSAVVIKILGDTKPLKQWEVAREFRKRLKLAFDKANIEIPFPQRVIHKAK